MFKNSILILEDGISFSGIDGTILQFDESKIDKESLHELEENSSIDDLENEIISDKTKGRILNIIPLVKLFEEIEKDDNCILSSEAWEYFKQIKQE